MDPKENIKHQVSLAADIQAIFDNRVGGDRENPELTSEQDTEAALLADQLSELVLSQHEWREKGGFDPYLPERMVLVIFEGDDDHLVLYDKPSEGKPGKVTYIGSEMQDQDHNDNLHPGGAAEQLAEHLGLKAMMLDLRFWQFGQGGADATESLIAYEAVGLTPENGMEDVYHLLASGKALEHPDLFPLAPLDMDLTGYSARYPDE